MYYFEGAVYIFDTRSHEGGINGERWMSDGFTIAGAFITDSDLESGLFFFEGINDTLYEFSVKDVFDAYGNGGSNTHFKIMFFQNSN